MTQPDPNRFKSRGRKERTPEQLKVLEMAREKARLVIAERTKIKTAANLYDLRTRCGGFSNALTIDPMLVNIPTNLMGSASFAYDPRPKENSPVFSNVDSFPSDSFWTQVSYKGAFGPEANDLWISCYTWLAPNDQLTDTAVCTANPSSPANPSSLANPSSPANSFSSPVPPPSPIPPPPTSPPPPPPPKLVLDDDDAAHAPRDVLGALLLACVTLLVNL